MGSLLQDIHYGLRKLTHKPGFAIVVILTIGLGIGVNTTVFSLVTGILLRPLPYDDPDQLVLLQATSRGEVANGGFTSYANLRDWRDQSQTLTDVGGFRGMVVTRTGVSSPEMVPGAIVTAGFFTAVRTDAALGRLFLSEEYEPGADDVVVLSHGFWQNQFAASPDAIGQKLELDKIERTIVGVLPENFEFPIEVGASAVWTPATRDAQTFVGRGAWRVRVLGRMAAGTTIEQVQAETNTIASRLEREYPGTNADAGVHVASPHEFAVRNVRPALILLMATVGIVLLIACANVANMLLARSEDRRREFAIRAALGAGRTRLLRQVLTENLLLGLFGGVLGLLLTVWATEVLTSLVGLQSPQTRQLSGVGAGVVGFTIAITLLTSLLCGLMPAITASRLGLNSELKESGRTSAGPRRNRLGRGLVVCEVALTSVLLVCTVLFTRSLQRLASVDLGFQPEQVLTFQLSIPLSGYSEPAKRAEFYRHVLARLQALPGIQSVGASTTLPLHPGYNLLGFAIEGRPPPEPPDRLSVRQDSVSAAYFKTMGVPLLAGRWLTEQDALGQPGVTLINQAMDERYWPDENPLGHRIVLGTQFHTDEPGTYEIVGVVGNVRDTRLDAGWEPYVYTPYQQITWPFLCFALRTSGNPTDLVGPIRSELAKITSDEAAFDFRTMDEYFRFGVRGPSIIAITLGVFATVALALAVLGIYGTLSYAVAQRTREIGIRIALGARCGAVLRHVLKQGVGLIVPGLGIGMVVALAVSRLLTSQLFEIHPADPLTYLAVPLLLGATALLACYVPARRATKVDPMVALRCE